MAHQTHSLFRKTFYNALKDIELNGTVLDLGGSRKSGYHELFQGSPVFTVVNIDEAYGYDLKFNVEEKFAVDDTSFDHVLCLNLLEHVYGYAHVLRESVRVMKPGGKFISVTPFSIPVHGCPHDYFRYTDSALRRMLEDAGLKVERIEPMGRGAFACMYQYGSWMLPSPLRTLARGLAVFMDRTLCGMSRRYKELSTNYVLGYLAVAAKPGA